MNVLVKEAGKYPYKKDIANELKPMHQLVGGYLQVVYFEIDSKIYAIVVDEEGLIKGYPFNKNVAGYDLYGTFFICKTEGEEFAGLTEEEMQQLIIFIE